MAVVQCPACQGKKRILGMGGIMKGCPTCCGIGWLQDIEAAKIKNTKAVSVKTEDDDKPVITIKKKRGRKPKFTDPETLRA